MPKIDITPLCPSTRTCKDIFKLGTSPCYTIIIESMIPYKAKKIKKYDVEAAKL